MTDSCLKDAACRILNTPDPLDKATSSHRVTEAWFAGKLEAPTRTAPSPPENPARPDRPPLVRPGDVPRRNRGKPAALIHAIAHIELNAIDLAWDLIARFADGSTPRDFLDDWVRVANDEAHHFELLNQRLKALGSFYGEFPAHDGLWETARDTRHDILARLAVIPLVLEARGLDVTPAMISRFHHTGDDATASVLERILQEEITHVRAGVRWFSYFCAIRQVNPLKTFKAAVLDYYKGRIKAPFNDLARRQAGIPPEYYNLPANSAPSTRKTPIY